MPHGGWALSECAASFEFVEPTATLQITWLIRSRHIAFADISEWPTILRPCSPGRRLSPYIPVGAEIGAYRIEAFLDRGGMASIYEATDLRLNRKVALKVLGHEVSDSTDFRERFMRESRFAASLDHPNIVPIYEAGEDDGLLYIAMRYVRGSNLAGLL